ncbi:MAG: hypothetical protein ABJB10_01415, partial [Mesorhizobium sp.]
LVRDEGVAGSNPATPTRKNSDLAVFPKKRFLLENALFHSGGPRSAGQHLLLSHFRLVLDSEGCF